MLTVLNTFACELGAVATRWYAWTNAPSPTLLMISGVLLFAALVVGLISLAILFVVLKIRKTRPPLGVIVFAVFVGVMPMVASAVISLLP